MYGLKLLEINNNAVCSPSYNLYWSGGMGTAVCRAFGGWDDWLGASSKIWHAAPDEDCNCGIHASFKYAVVYNYFIATLRWEAYNPSKFFLALVEAGGKVIVHDRGLRCETARIVALVHDDEWTAYMDAERILDVPVISLDQAEKRVCTD